MSRVEHDVISDVECFDSNSLLENGSVFMADGFGICEDEVEVPLCGVISDRARTKHASRQCVLGADENAGSMPEEGKDASSVVGVPPANAKLKFVDVPRVPHSAELPSLLSRVQMHQCPECFNLSDECNLCEESSARALLTGYSGAADPLGGYDLPEWSKYSERSSSKSEKHSLDELSHVIRQVENFQADGYLAKVTEI